MMCYERTLPSRSHARRLMKYGLTAEVYNKLIEAQDNSCAICRAPFIKTPHVDHDHSDGRVRGLLCAGCNLFCGMLENTEKRESATLYLGELL